MKKFIKTLKKKLNEFHEILKVYGKASSYAIHR